MESIDSLKLHNRNVMSRIIGNNTSKRNMVVDNNNQDAIALSTAIALINRKGIKDPKRQKNILRRVINNNRGNYGNYR